MADPASWLLPDADRVLLVISILLCGMLGFYAFSKRVLDGRASFLASAIGLILIWFADMFWFFLLLVFLIVSYFVTIWRYDQKKDRGTSQGRKGERGVKNVLANGSVPLIIAIFNQPIDSLSEGLSGFMFVTAIAIATADTFGSEIGIMADEPRMITHPSKKVKPGKDGGVSSLGNVAALIGSLFISIIGVVLVSDLLVVWGPHGMQAGIIPLFFITVIGWIGCQIDSVLGATLQQKGLLTNNTVNFVTIGLGSLISIPIYMFLVTLV
jgi:uncharacterized protein (TIGR00297 family)